MLTLKEENGRTVALETTIDDVLYAIEYLKHQRELQHAKYRRHFVPSANPPGRPRKAPAEEKPKRPVGRPRKVFPAQVCELSPASE